jgi:RimJ/RimL family protein N-acetyltransferase
MNAIGPGSLRLRTARLVIRPVEDADAAATAALVTPDVAANLSTWPSPMSLAQASARISLSKTMLAARDAVDFAIVGRDRGELLGWIGLARLEGGNARLGYWLGTAFRGRGLMKEAARTAVPAGAALLRADRIIALVLKANAPSIAVLHATGFHPAGEERVRLEVARTSRLCLRFELIPDQAR